MGIEEKICRCVRCGHEWVRRVGHRPVCCPKCITPYWDRERGEVPRGRPRKTEGKAKPVKPGSNEKSGQPEGRLRGGRCYRDARV